MATTEHQHNVVLSTRDYDVVGTRPTHYDSADEVTGRALYGADFQASEVLGISAEEVNPAVADTDSSATPAALAAAASPSRPVGQPIRRRST